MPGICVVMGEYIECHEEIGKGSSIYLDCTFFSSPPRYDLMSFVCEE